MIEQPVVDDKIKYLGISRFDLVDFENQVARNFNNSQIKAPVHLYHGNEDEMIEIFRRNLIGASDWVLCSWRSHYQCLLKGVPPEQLMKAILEQRSISLCFREYKILSSAIVAGSLPIAVGIAFDLKRKNEQGKVYVFMGDMTSETGLAHECIKYARNHQLPIHFIIEDNSKSVCTDTRYAWAMNKLTYEGINDEYITYYTYDLQKYPHAGAGKRVQF